MSKGFSLIEIILVLGMVMIMAGITSPLFSRNYTQNEVQNVTDQIASSLRQAQYNTLVGKNGSKWGVGILSGNLITFSGDTLAGRTTALDQKFLIASGIAVSGLTEVVFSKLTGTPSAALTINVSGLGTTNTISVNSQGMISK